MTGIHDSTTTTTPDSIDLPTIALTNQNWWDEDDFPYNAPWWLRYPASAAVAALPVSIAIIIGAMIIAQAIKR